MSDWEAKKAQHAYDAMYARAVAAEAEAERLRVTLRATEETWRRAVDEQDRLSAENERLRAAEEGRDALRRLVAEYEDAIERGVLVARAELEAEADCGYAEHAQLQARLAEVERDRGRWRDSAQRAWEDLERQRLALGRRDGTVCLCPENLVPCPLHG